MKKHGILKTVQLFLFIALTFLCLYRIFTTPELYRLIGTNPDVKLISGLLWVVLGLSYLFIFLDYTFLSSYKRITGNWIMQCTPTLWPASPTVTAATP